MVLLAHTYRNHISMPMY
ncbi:hypothetical protein F383_28799 [Gossypium arboreum]|uniref:Uncharacterized protein n=1 Tax=Gossypium arboreum TaxID=29729 RepID=A0A0B0PIU9_GOSAR|nr:hypothetical protein F383_28799 [Gossypium arboreum]